MDPASIIAVCSFLILLTGLIGYLNNNLKDALKAEVSQIKKEVGSLKEDVEALKKDVEIIKEAVLKN